MKEVAIKEKADLEKRIDELEKENNLEKGELKERIAELMKQKIDEKKRKDDILDLLAREVTCSVCLMIPRTKRIPICRNGHTTCETCKR